MNQALKEAKKAFLLGEVPVGAVVVYKGTIIGRGYNKKISTNDPTMHAEILAIKEASRYLRTWHLEECSLYTTLEPCSMCGGALLNSRIGKVYIGTRDPRMGSLGSSINLSNIKTFNHSFKVEFGILERESRDLLGNFFKVIRQRKKLSKKD